MISEIGSIAMVNAIMFVVAMGVYLVVVRNSNPLKLTQALLAGLSVVARSINVSAVTFLTNANRNFR
jgi:hypothetical protein